MTKKLNINKSTPSYSAKDIEVLEGLDPVRLRPGMYIGSTDVDGIHHLVNEILDNAMDEVVEGYANEINIFLDAYNNVSIKDNGRGIPIDNHQNFKNKSALEVICTTLHAGGKFSGNSYKTSGGLHGVGLSVVNALSEYMQVKVFKKKTVYEQTYKKGEPITKLLKVGKCKEQGTQITFKPDIKIFGEDIILDPQKIYEICKHKAFLFKGIKINWSYNSMFYSNLSTPSKETLFFSNGLIDFLNSLSSYNSSTFSEKFTGIVELKEIKIEWALNWLEHERGNIKSFCNTIYTSDGGTHEIAFKTSILKAIKSYGLITNNKQINSINIDDCCFNMTAIISIFIEKPEFQGQTKHKLGNKNISKLIETAVKDRLEIWLSQNRELFNKLADCFVGRMQDRINKKNQLEFKKKSSLKRIFLPGKLADCSEQKAEGTEIFIVEGDSAGGSAKQARYRTNQAILALRGKILNVASSTHEKLINSKEINDIILSLGCGIRENFDIDKLRYERIIIMTDADVDGAHITSLLLTFFLQEMPEIIKKNKLFIAQPPLFRLSDGKNTYYAKDDEHKNEIINNLKSKKKIYISRFKGLGEMPAPQLKMTTMNPENRNLMRVSIKESEFLYTIDFVNDIMGKKAEKRLTFIQENARFKNNINILKDI